MSKHFVIKVEIISCADFVPTITEIAERSKALGISIETTFNGLDIYITPETDLEEFFEMHEDMVKDYYMY